jgi:hypothetical protein
VSADGRITLIRRLKSSRNPLIAFRNHPALPLALRQPANGGKRAARFLGPVDDGKARAAARIASINCA